MITVTVISVLLVIMAYTAMMLMNRQISALQEEISALYAKQDKYNSRLADCEEVTLYTAKLARKHDQQYACIIAKQKENERAIEHLKGF